MANTSNGRPDGSPRQNPPGIRADFEQNFRQNLEQGLARTVWATVFQRDAQKGTARKTGQSLQVYDAGGNLTNPASDAPFLEELHTRTADLIRESTSGMSQSEAEVHLKRMSRVLPDLVKALVLDDDYITDVYRPDLLSVAKVAVDWFSHPEQVANTRFRIGVGGEELVSGRIPSYIIPALKTLNGVQDAFRSYTLWAINDQLHERVPRSEGGDPISEWIQQRVNQVAQPRTDNTQIAQPVTLQELPYEQAVQVLQVSWQHFLGEPLNLSQLQQGYHATDQLPELVVFNPSHAAININHMDPGKVLSAREQAQALLRGYVQRFHPNLANRLVFQNDRPWREHDFATKMQILFARDLVRSFDGDRERAQQRIEEFGRHHQKFQGETMLGMSPSELYAMLHPFFFEDPAVTVEPTQRMPATKVMQPLPIARHVAYHQGAPEIEFGIFRKLYTQNATIDAFAAWLERRALVASQPLDAVAAQILDVARQNMQQGGKSFVSNLYPALNALRQAQPELSRILLDYAISDRIKRAPNPEAAWAELVQELREAKPQEEPGQLLALKDRLTVYRRTAEARRDEINLASLTGNRTSLDELAQDETTERMYYPLTHLENVIRVGAGGPVYYVVEGADSVVYPQLESVSLQKYTTALDSANARQTRLKRSTQAVTRLFSPVAATEISGVIPDGLVTEDWQRRWAERIKTLYSLIDAQEAGGIQVTPDALNQGVASLRAEMIADLGQIAGININSRPDLIGAINQEVLPTVAKAAMDETMSEGAAQIFKLSAIRQDYLLMLRDINPNDQSTAEVAYNEFLRENFGPRRRHR